MNKRTLRNFWLAIALFLLLGSNIVVINTTRPWTTDSHTGLHVHVILSILLALGCLIHIGLHWQWYPAVLSGKAQGRVKLVMTGMVAVMMLLAGLSGHEALTFAGRFHSFTGSMALIGLSIHGIKHIRWMAVTAKRLIANSVQGNAVEST
ncbi:MAG: hypothetical protein AB1649_11515 [Chloroflexota bacterium]